MLTDVEPRVSSPVLVGRSGQLSALDAALAETGQGHPSAVLVGGEAGVGKSRLVREFARAVTRYGGAGTDRRLPRARRGQPAVHSLHRRAPRASELFISAKTASVHVSNILAKLGVTSRGEAAATAHRLRLFDSLS